tara:strand:- start:663 stop:1166 length:504 start_codon:yes stop_codon:yes gene_type:complete
MSKDHLSIDIYKDTYPKPKLVDDGLPDVMVVDDKIVIPNLVNSPTYVNSPTHVNSTTYVNSQEIARQEKTPEITPEKETNNNEVIVYNNKAIYATILCILSCIGIGIMCILIALKQNQPSDKHMIYLEGQIVYVFYLGVAILTCIGFCLCSFSCARCCGDLCPIFCM